MLKQISRIAFAASACVAVTAINVAVDAQTYQLPPKAVVDILDAAPTPTLARPTR